MRVGQNPNKNSNQKNKPLSYHRVVVPVYIPNLTDAYFKNSFQVLKVCLESILVSIHESTRLSIISNGCCEEVKAYLEEQYSSHELFDQLFQSKVNLGKINAVLTVLKSCQEELITVTDADVMFKIGWQQAVEAIFKDFPEAGMVSPVPHSKGFSNFGYSNAYFGLFMGKIYFDTLKDPAGLKKFEESLQRNTLKPIHYQKYLVIDNGNGKAVMGCGHFVATYRKECFLKTPNQPSKDLLSTHSDNEYLDLPNEKAGFLRLATLENHAFHLGNHFESWMQEELKKNLQQAESFSFTLTAISIAKPLKSYQIAVGKWAKQLLFHRFRRIYFKYLGENNF